MLFHSTHFTLPINAMAAFATPIRLDVSITSTTTNNVHSTRKHAVCVQEKNLRVATKSPTLSKPVKSKYYHVIDPKLEPASSLPPAPPVHNSVPFIGFALEHMLDMATPKSRAAKYGPLYQSNFFRDDFLWVTKLDPMDDILRDPSVFSSNVNNFKFSFFIGADSFMFKDGRKHLIERNKIAPAFSPSMFPLYFERLRATTESFWDTIADRSKTRKVMLDSELRNFFMGNTIELTTGVSANSQISSTVRELFMDLLNGMLGPAWGPIWDINIEKRDELVQILSKITNDKLVNEADIIEEFRKSINEKSSVSNVKSLLKSGADILQAVLAGVSLKTGPNQSHDPVEFEKLINLLILLWAAGFFTTSATTSCAIFELGMNTNIRRRLVAEQEEIVKKAGSREVRYEQLDNMPLLDSYLAEIMRLYPAGNGVMRMVEKDVVLLGKKVSKGTTLFLDLQAALRDDAIYPNADTLVMDRFLKDENGRQEARKILAFGGKGSPHFCIGAALATMMIRTNIAVMLRNYRIELDPKQTRKYRQVPDYTPASKIVLESMHERQV